MYVSTKTLQSGDAGAGKMEHTIFKIACVSASFVGSVTVVLIKSSTDLQTPQSKLYSIGKENFS